MNKQKYNKMYYQKNKSKILSQMYVKYKCDVCDCEIIRKEKPRHDRTAKHHKNLIKKGLKPIKKGFCDLCCVIPYDLDEHKQTRKHKYLLSRFNKKKAKQQKTNNNQLNEQSTTQNQTNEQTTTQNQLNEQSTTHNQHNEQLNTQNQHIINDDIDKDNYYYYKQSVQTKKGLKTYTLKVKKKKKSPKNKKDYLNNKKLKIYEIYKKLSEDDKNKFNQEINNNNFNIDQVYKRLIEVN